MGTQRICSIDGCGKKHSGRGLCAMHWQQRSRAGSLGPLEPKPSWKFIEAAISSETDECIDWPFAKSGCGYGQYRKGSRMHRAHRVVCEARHGVAPKDKPFACHGCGRRCCINPRHLSWGSYQDNAEDSVRHGTTAAGEKNGNNKITAEDARLIFVSIESQVSLSKRFKITRSAVQLIQSREMWRSATADLTRP